MLPTLNLTLLEELAIKEAYSKYNSIPEYTIDEIIKELDISKAAYYKKLTRYGLHSPRKIKRKEKPVSVSHLVSTKS